MTAFLGRVYATVPAEVFMARYYNPRDPHFRRSPNGRSLVRSRLTPGMLRAPQPAPRSRLPGLLLRLLFGLAVLVAVLILAGVGVAYSSYTQLADSLTPRLDKLAH